ncbi:MAG: 3-oxoacyl-ACP reductase [Rhodospirillaceae bacterium]|nr:3-oxoacyl-ACP reductase [Rhodospirillaceae bacterium]
MTDKDSSVIRVAIVTGGGTGIGKAAALALQATGHHVALAGRRVEPLEETASESKGKGPAMLAVPSDIRDPDQVRSVFDKTVKTFGRLDVLFNNAGIGTPSIPSEDLDIEDWKRTVDVNLTGAFLCAQHAIRIMKKQTPKGGRIINNGSVSAQMPRPHSAAYTATKHALTGLTKSLALDGRLHDIACSQIDIGNADTHIAAGMKTGMPQADGEMRQEPLIDPVHCGEVVAYIAGLPLDTNVLFTNIMATKMPFVGRG